MGFFVQTREALNAERAHHHVSSESLVQQIAQSFVFRSPTGSSRLLRAFMSLTRHF